MALEHTQSRLFVLHPSSLAEDIQAFLIDCQARRLSPRTVKRYGDELRYLREWLEPQGAHERRAITPGHLRAYLIHLGDRGRNAGGQNIVFRIMRAFLKWHEREFDHWGQNSISKVRAPKLSKEPLPPVPVDDVKAMLATCKSRGFKDMRDKTMIMCLLDTGARASEFLALDIYDINMATGRVTIREGKGGKARVVFLGAKSRRQLMRYLRLHRHDLKVQPALWVSTTWGRLTHSGLWRMLKRRAKAAGLPMPPPHSFRRAFALACL